jgi:hypothetical protein
VGASLSEIVCMVCVVCRRTLRTLMECDGTPIIELVTVIVWLRVPRLSTQTALDVSASGLTRTCWSPLR